MPATCAPESSRGTPRCSPRLSLSATSHSPWGGGSPRRYLPAGAPLPAGALTGPQAQSPALTLSIPEFQVTGAGLQAGDRVTVLATFGAGGGQASTRPVARGLQVMAVGEAGANADPSTATVPVTVAVSEPSMTSQLALANEDAKLDLLVEGSAASTAPIPSASQASVGGGP